MSKVITLRKLSDFETTNIKNNFTQVSVTSTQALPDDSYTFDETLKAFRIKDASTTKTGNMQFSFSDLQIGDSVEITAEVMSVSGSKPQININYNGSGNMASVTSSKVGEFETIKLKGISAKNGGFYIQFGLNINTYVGEYYIRNVKIKIEGSGQNDYVWGLVRTTRNYYINLNAGVATLIDAKTGDRATLSLTATDVVINHEKPFNVAFGANGYINGDHALHYVVRARAEGGNGLKLIISDPFNKAYVDPRTLTNTSLSVVCFGANII